MNKKKALSLLQEFAPQSGIELEIQKSRAGLTLVANGRRIRFGGASQKQDIAPYQIERLQRMITPMVRL